MQSNEIFDEMIGLKPALSGLGGRDDFVQLITYLEDYYSQPIFQNSPTSSDLKILTGENEVIIDNTSSTISYFDNSDSQVAIYDGTHDLILSESKLKLDQHSGSTSFYLENISGAELELNVWDGEVVIYSADPNADLAGARLQAGRLNLFDEETDVIINNMSDEPLQIRIFSLDNKNETILTAPADASYSDVSEEIQPVLVVNETSLSSNNPIANDAEIVLNSDESYIQMPNVFFEDDVIVPSSSDHAPPINLQIPTNLPTDVFLDDQIDLVIHSTEILAQESKENIEIAQVEIGESIEFDTDVLISVEGYSDMIFENALDIIDDI